MLKFMQILLFDTETTGKPLRYNASYQEVENWPRVIQLSWILADQGGNVLTRHDCLIKPNGWIMPTEPFWIEHGFNHEKSLAEGIPIEEALELFYQDKLQAQALVAHNLNFDHRIVWAEFIRAGRLPISGLTKFCTMMTTSGLCKLPQAKGRGYKWPKLEELYFFLFGKPMEGAHDALADTTALKEVFFELLRRGHLKLEQTPKL
jgi:DNA polymerase-3 subunit epsilon